MSGSFDADHTVFAPVIYIVTMSQNPLSMIGQTCLNNNLRVRCESGVQGFERPDAPSLVGVPDFRYSVGDCP